MKIQKRKLSHVVNVRIRNENMREEEWKNREIEIHLLII